MTSPSWSIATHPAQTFCTPTSTLFPGTAQEFSRCCWSTCSKSQLAECYARLSLGNLSLLPTGALAMLPACAVRPPWVRAVTNAVLCHVPHSYAHQQVDGLARELGYDNVHRIYAVGDNPQSDIAGANAAGDPFVSVLVHTGVFHPDRAHSTNDATHPAAVTARDVNVAVDAIQKHEGV